MTGCCIFQWIGLRENKNSRKPSIFPMKYVNMGVSYIYSLTPIHWFFQDLLHHLALGWSWLWSWNHQDSMQNFPGHPPFQRGTKKGETLIQRIWVNLGSLGGPEIMVTLWYIICYIAIEHGHRNSWSTHRKWWFSIVMLVYQRVNPIKMPRLFLIGSVYPSSRWCLLITPLVIALWWAEVEYRQKGIKSWIGLSENGGHSVFTVSVYHKILGFWQVFLSTNSRFCPAKTDLYL